MLYLIGWRLSQAMTGCATSGITTTLAGDSSADMIQNESVGGNLPAGWTALPNATVYPLPPLTGRRSNKWSRNPHVSP